jgi:HK97 gp10 family phage protein
MVKIRGAAWFQAKLGRLASPDATRSIGRALFRAGQLVEQKAGELITEGSVSGKGHVPSRPGEPPQNDTDVLARAIETAHEREEAGRLVVEVSSNALYAAALEYGTSKMAERPYMRPALAARKDEVAALIVKVIDHVNKGGRIR